MGIDTRLLISSKWELDDVRTVLKKYLECDTTLEYCDASRSFKMDIKGNGIDRRIFILTNRRTPLGSNTYMSIRSDPQSIKIMHTIADVLGGYLNEAYTNDYFEGIDGMFYDEEGLPYFLEYAMLNNELKNVNDLVGLNKSIHDWQKKHHTKTMNLFDVEAP